MAPGSLFRNPAGLPTIQHRVIAARLQAHPALMEIARNNLARWSASAGRSQPYWDAWREILNRPLPEVLALLEEDARRPPSAPPAPAVRGAAGPPAVTRAQLEHIMRASGTIADDNDIVVIGSQAILGKFPNAPAELLVSNEAYVYPRVRTERSDLIDATIGEGSPLSARVWLLRPRGR